MKIKKKSPFLELKLADEMRMSDLARCESNSVIFINQEINPGLEVEDARICFTFFV